jgi:peptidoglycan/xylan/chitin deacetylase (PgdA/CDA1 family)
MKRQLLALITTACLLTSFSLTSPQQVAIASTPSLPRVTFRIQTKDPVVFITIDDGSDMAADAHAVLERLQWPVTSFVLPNYLRADPQWFTSLGSVNDIGSHTTRHTVLKRKSLAVQTEAICGGHSQVASVVPGAVPYFRPPTGLYDNTTLLAASSCGITDILLWRVSVNGLTITTWGGDIRAGDIILIHYVGSLAKSLRRLENELLRLHLRPARLSDYLNSGTKKAAPQRR